MKIAQTENIQAHLVLAAVAGKSVSQEIYFVSNDDPEKRIIWIKLDLTDTGWSL